MSSFNKVILMGRLTRDPELRYTPSNLAICKVGLAVNRRVKNRDTGEWNEEPTFVDVTIFDKRGEAFEKYHSKGSLAFVEGRLHYDTWEDKNTGQKRSKLEVIAENWEFVGGREERGGGGQRQQPASAPAGAPTGGEPGGGYGDYGAGSGDGGGGAGAGTGGGGSDFLEVDDTPF